MKDQRNKNAHEDSAQLACEAAGAIRTVASLTREDDCLELYSQTLEQPLRDSKRTALWSNLLYSISQSFEFFAIALTFWWFAAGVIPRVYLETILHWPHGKLEWTSRPLM